MNFEAQKLRRKTRVVMVGNVGIGGDEPIRVQTMTNTDTLDIEATAAQTARCVAAGAELVRITTQSPKHAKALGDIRTLLKKKYDIEVPLIADVHFSQAAAFAALEYADKVRLNPGNLLDIKLQKELEYGEGAYEKELARIEEGLLPFIQKAKELRKSIRIGANHGSLSDRILSRYGDTPVGMVESAMEYLRIFHKHSYDEIVVAMKSSDPLVMIEANRLLAHTMDVEGMDYPIHLGVTEAGNAEDGRAKSTIGIGTALLEGIGDTLRVSLTEAPEKEIPVCYSILQATRRRITKTEFISCPSCGRTLYDIETVTNTIKERMGHLVGVRIAVMGCIVNGIGEMADADFGYVGGRPGMISLYWKKQLVARDVPEHEAIERLIALIKEKGLWVESKKHVV
ncbi:MAG: (E)-4-hydroxy-3-methylbut-2-enyl-diphosphate synthase [Candidatus Moraniibacteriota bacterium]